MKGDRKLMSKKTREKKKRARAWYRYYENLIRVEKEKVKGCTELSMIHSAYISVLLNKLGATEKNVVNITFADIKDALTKYETKVIPTENGYGLYCEVVKDEVQAKATTIKREEKN